MCTAEPEIYAIGDIVPTPAPRPRSSAEGIVAVEHIKGLNPQPLNDDHLPNATYTDPEVASVRLTEKKAKERGYDMKIGKFPLTATSKAKIIADAGGLVKCVVDAKYDEILGVHNSRPEGDGADRRNLRRAWNSKRRATRSPRLSSRARHCQRRCWKQRKM